MFEYRATFRKFDGHEFQSEEWSCHVTTGGMVDATKLAISEVVDNKENGLLWIITKLEIVRFLPEATLTHTEMVEQVKRSMGIS